MNTDKPNNDALDNGNGPKYFKVLRSKENDLKIGIKPDQMQAYLSMDSDLPGRYFTVSEIMELLEEEKIVHGVMRHVIDEMVSSANKSDEVIRDVIIAEGSPVTEGIATRIEYHFNADGTLDLTEDGSGNIDFKELNLINNVKKDDLLATLIRGQEGRPGLDIYGNTVQPNPVLIEISLATGKNVRMSEDGKTCYADRDGQVFLRRKLIEVSPIYMVPHDVDLNTGNISFNGSVVVHGNVLAGFSIRAKEDVTILGIVEAADITSGGNVFIKGGIKGNDRGKILCRGELITSFIESGVVESHGNLRVNTSIVNSTIICHGIISMGQKKGQIVGGEVLAARGIKCREAGSKFGVNTVLTIGDKSLVRKKLEDLELEVKEIEGEYQQILSGMQQHERLFINLKMLPEDKKKPLLAILARKEELKSQMKGFEDRKAKLMILLNMRCFSELRVTRHCHPNVSITIGHSHMHVKEEYTNRIFREDYEIKKISVIPGAS